MNTAARVESPRDAVVESDFVMAEPAAVASLLDDDSIHLWRLPYRRAQRRAPLCALLAAYLGIDAGAVMLHDDEYGKPRLLDHHDANAGTRHIEINCAQEATPKRTTRNRDSEPLRFSWSHSGEMALAALARGIEPGVDVEWLRERMHSLELAHRFFDPAEALALAAYPEASRETAFLRLWCAKEAVLKALGRGIAFGLERVAFARIADCWRPARFAAEAGDASAWKMQALSPAPGYIGALAWCGAPRKVRAWRALTSE
ncbi:MAG: 4'-phosphopantetheinyl transferase superfamily protein [Rhodanobacteraceae bacterium]